MKKSFFFVPLFSLVFCFPAFAQYTNVVPVEYNNTEYQANGAAWTAVGADKAYGTDYDGFSGAGVTVAVIDGGTQMSHQDLKDRTSLLQGEDFNPQSSEHGTHVAGIIAGSKNNLGMHGIAYNASLVPFSTLMVGGCLDILSCMSTEEAWQALLDDKFNDVKIINNSWGAGDQPLDQYTANKWSEEIALTKQLAEKDKLVVSAAGNETQLMPSPYPAGLPYYDNSLKNNVINVVAYNPALLPDDPQFIAAYSNLAVNAQKWSIAAPGTGIYSTIPYELDTDNKYIDDSGTSMAAPVVSGAAALVQEAFPYMGGKQIGDVLFSTAFKKEDLTLSPYMVQEGDGITRVLFFTDNTLGITYEQAEALFTAAGYACGGSVACNKVTFEDVFGQGLLNIGAAVKGPGYFDAERLSAADYDAGTKQFFYSVDTLGKDSTWAHDIGQKKLQSADLAADQQIYAQADIGLKKIGEGILTLTGQNTFLGMSVVQGGQLKLSGGSLLGNVVVNGGTFYMEDVSNVGGSLTVNTSGSFHIDGGTLGQQFENKGTAVLTGGDAVGDVINTGTLVISGFESGGSVSLGQFRAAGNVINKNQLQFKEKGWLKGNLDNQADIIASGESSFSGVLNNTLSGKVNINEGGLFKVSGGSFENAGGLYGKGEITGTVNNRDTGSIATSLKIQSLNSSGNILIVPGSAGATNAQLQVDTLNITGGQFTLMPGQSYNYENGQRYTFVNFNTLGSFNNFADKSKFSDFIFATTHLEADKIDATIDFIRMAQAGATKAFDQNEKTVAQVMDSMFFEKANSDFKGYYYLSADGLKREINAIRTKAQPIQNERLPLTKTMASQVYTHLFQVQMNRDASSFNRYRPSQPYRGSYYRGRSGGSPKLENKVWGQFLGGRVVEDADINSDRGEIKTKSIGGMFGYDHEISQNHLIGITGGFATATLKQDEDEVDVKDYRAGIYTGSRFGRFTFNSMIMGGFQQYETSRYTNIIGLNSQSRGEFNGYSAEMDVKLGFDFMRLPYRDYSFYVRLI